MKEGEARMAQLDWAGPYDYRTFFGALDNHLKWWTVKKAVPGADQKPIVASSELKIIPLIQFCQNTKGMPATGKSKEIDDWVASIATDGTPDQILATFVKEPPKDPEMIQVPDPGAAIRKFEEFWAVANLARWDFRLNQMLALYVQKYSELLKIEDPSSKGYLDRTAATGKEFQKVYGDTTKHLATTKPGSKEFPGFGPDEWRRNFDADYDKLMRFTVVVPGVINENARNRIKGQMESDWKNLEAQILAYAYLVVGDPQNPSKKSWSPAAAAISPMLVEVTSYADLAAFEAAENPKAVVEEASRKSTPADQKATLEAFSKKQVDAKAKATANVTAIAGIPPEQKAPWQDGLARGLRPEDGRPRPRLPRPSVHAAVPRPLDRPDVPGERLLHAQPRAADDPARRLVHQLRRGLVHRHAPRRRPARAGARRDHARLPAAATSTGSPGAGAGEAGAGSSSRARPCRRVPGASSRPRSPAGAPSRRAAATLPCTDISGALTFDDVQAFAANRRLNPVARLLQEQGGSRPPRRAARRRPRPSSSPRRTSSRTTSSRSPSRSSRPGGSSPSPRTASPSAGTTPSRATRRSGAASTDASSSPSRAGERT